MKLIKFLVLVIAGVTVISCSDEFLNPLPDSAVAVDAFFQSDEDVLAGVIGIYDALQGVNENTETNIGRANRGVQFEHLLTEHRSDNTRNSTLEGSKSDFDRYTVDPNNVESEDYYQSMYQVIFDWLFSIKKTYAGSGSSTISCTCVKNQKKNTIA